MISSVDMIPDERQYLDRRTSVSRICRTLFTVGYNVIINGGCSNKSDLRTLAVDLNKTESSHLIQIG